MEQAMSDTEKQILEKLEQPGLPHISEIAVQLSIAISLKRIADMLQRQFEPARK
jgi:DNA-binding Lrp family transcriptional regulator